MGTINLPGITADFFHPAKESWGRGEWKRRNKKKQEGRRTSWLVKHSDHVITLKQGKNAKQGSVYSERRGLQYKNYQVVGTYVCVHACAQDDTVAIMFSSTIHLGRKKNEGRDWEGGRKKAMTIWLSSHFLKTKSRLVDTVKRVKSSSSFQRTKRKVK